ncbi:hypothetical protein HRED_07716 [Candidatus Haloredivivus sp. G17]|nr:hypothetical protein HRED_07716 [Candidatus Haloredivivus sp. G17]
MDLYKTRHGRLHRDRKGVRRTLQSQAGTNVAQILQTKKMAQKTDKEQRQEPRIRIKRIELNDLEPEPA